MPNKPLMQPTTTSQFEFGLASASESTLSFANKMKYLLTAIFLITIIKASGDNIILQRATESSFVFEDGTQISMKRSFIGDLESVTVTMGDKSFKFTNMDFGKIPDPLLNSVNLSESTQGMWNLTVSYAEGQKWSNASSELTISFSTKGYLGKELKIPTGKDQWIYKRQKAGMAEEDAGKSSVVTPSSN